MIMVDPLERRTLLSRIDLDPTWGNSAFADGEFELGPSQNISGQQITSLPGAKLEVTGLASKNVNDVFGYDFLRLRINADGTIDSTQRHDVGHPLDYINASITQPDGKTLFTGTTISSSDMSVMRVNADGSIDTGFGTNGIGSVFRQQELSGIVEQAWRIGVQPDGKFLIAGDRSDVLTSPDDRRAQVFA